MAYHNHILFSFFLTKKRSQHYDKTDVKPGKVNYCLLTIRLTRANSKPLNMQQQQQEGVVRKRETTQASIAQTSKQMMFVL